MKILCINMLCFAEQSLLFIIWETIDQPLNLPNFRYMNISKIQHTLSRKCVVQFTR